MDTLIRFIWDDSAQDVVEYAFLGLFVGLVGLALWPVIVTLLGQRYTDYNCGVQALWDVDNPGTCP